MPKEAISRAIPAGKNSYPGQGGRRETSHTYRKKFKTLYFWPSVGADKKAPPDHQVANVLLKNISLKKIRRSNKDGNKAFPVVGDSNPPCLADEEGHPMHEFTTNFRKIIERHGPCPASSVFPVREAYSKLPK